MKNIYKFIWCLGLSHLILTFIISTTVTNFINVFIGLVLVIGAFISYKY